MTVSDC